MRRWAGLAVVVVAAMALGRVITDHVTVEGSADRPFVHTGSLGSPVHLEYADVTATGVRAAPAFTGTSPVKAGGRFLVVDLKVVARSEPTSLQGLYLLDGEGRRYAPTDRGTGCAKGTQAPTGLPWYLMVCFDVPERALEGARIVVARGGYGVNGSGQRRDDQARISLGIDGGDADRLWSAGGAFEPDFPGLAPLDTSRKAAPT